METLVLLPIIVALYLVYRNNANKSSCSSGITKIDDKYWIINNEIVSFDDNDDFHIMKQKMEDDRIWFEYVRYRKTDDIKRVSEQWYNIKMSPEYDKLLSEVTEDDKRNVEEEYESYLEKCKHISWDTPLTKEEYCMIYKGANIFLLLYIPPMFLPGIYNIYSSDNAKYSDGMMKKLEQEFKDKYY